MRRVAILVTLIGGVAAAAIGGCGGSVPRQAVDEVAPVWPLPPAAPRIQYLESISSAADIDANPGLLRRIVTFLKGEVERRVTRPHGVAVDGEGRLYVVDTLYQAVHVFDREKRRHDLFPSQSLEGFENPIGVAVDDDGGVYVTDSVANVVHLFSHHGKRYVGAVGKGLFERPTGVAYDRETGRILVADTRASSLVVLDVKSREVVATIGGGEQGRRFHAPTNVSVAPGGTIVVTDALNFRVQVLNREFETIATLGAAGDSPGYFSRPKGIAVDADGHIYVVDALFGNVQIFDSTGRLLLAFGRPGIDIGEFWLPADIFIDRWNRIYVSDAYNRRVQVFQYIREPDGTT